MVGRAHRCARTSHGAIAPAPITVSVCGSAGASSLAPTAESAAVFHKVISVPSITASGCPSVPSNSTYTACTAGRRAAAGFALARLPGKLVKSLLPIAMPPSIAERTK